MLWPTPGRVQGWGWGQGSDAELGAGKNSWSQGEGMRVESRPVQRAQGLARGGSLRLLGASASASAQGLPHL